MVTDTLSLTELARLAGVTPRTVRYYIQHGLLPAPAGSGPGAHYDRGYVDRLRLIKRLQKAHLPLAEIRKRVSGLADEEVRRLQEEPQPAEPPADSAAEYVRSVLEGGRLDQARLELASPSFFPAAPHEAGEAAYEPSPTTQRSQWDRIVIDPDIELHIRRPLSREKNRALHDLLDHVRNLFGSTEEP